MKIVLAALMAVSLSACADPYEDWPMRPAGYTKDFQMLEERETGCVYYIIKGQTELKPLLRMDKTQIGCKKNG